MKSRSAFEFTVRKMLRQSPKVYFWTFTFREVHSLKTAMRLWNQFLTLLKRRLQFRGVRVLELHEEHGCHFHVLTNRRFAIRTILVFCERYGFGRVDVRQVKDVAKALGYICKYLAKLRPRCLKRARLWSAFGDIERTRVTDVLIDTPRVRLLRHIMGKPSVQDELNGISHRLSERRNGDRNGIFVGRCRKRRSRICSVSIPITWNGRRFGRKLGSLV